MHCQKRYKSNEKGSVIGAVLLILVLLSLIGVASVSRSNTELNTASNEIVYKQNIYSAESAAIQNTYAIENTDPADLTNEDSLNWLNRPSDLPAQDNIFNEDNWTDVNSTAAIETGSRFMTVSEGVVPGGSLDMSVSQIYEYSIYSRCKRNQGLSIVRLGYRRAIK